VHDLLTRRTLLVNGKGGVGKTTVAAALAHLAAGMGKRVLVAEIAADARAASPLARALGHPSLDEEPARVAPNLSAVVLTPAAGHVRFLRETLPVGKLADLALRTAAIRRFLHAAPTLSEMGVLYRLLDLVRATRAGGEPEHELVVVDLPATGHALGLAQVPTTILQVIHAGPIAAAVREGLAMLRDGARTTSVVVTLPERLPVSEASELVAGLRRHEIPFGGVVLNRVPRDPFVGEERAAVDALVKGRALLGMRTLPRLDGARAALARLRELSLPVSLLDEVASEGPLALALAPRFGPLT